MNTYNEALAQQAAQNDKAQRDEVNARGWAAILDRYPLVDCQANFAALVEWANPLTLESFNELMRTRPAGLTLAATSREGLIDELVANSFGDSNTKRQLRYRLSTYSLAQIRQAKREQDFKKVVSNADEARKFIADERAKEPRNQWNGFPVLPNQIVPPGEVRSVPTGDYVRRVAKSDVFELKRLCRLYSTQQINYWLVN